MPTTVPKEPTVAALHDVWARLDALLAGLSDDDWQRPTCLPGWNVQAVAAHLIGTESMLLGVGAPALTISEATHPHVRNDIGSFNEAWVEALAAEPPADVLARFRDDVAKRKEALAAMTAEEWDKVGFTPAGQDTYGRFMQIRVFDQWMHELDIRDADRARRRRRGPGRRGRADRDGDGDGLRGRQEGRGAAGVAGPPRAHRSGGARDRRRGRRAGRRRRRSSPARRR